jgi:hypothetical protein
VPPAQGLQSYLLTLDCQLRDGPGALVQRTPDRPFHGRKQVRGHRPVVVHQDVISSGIKESNPAMKLALQFGKNRTEAIRPEGCPGD